MRKYYLGRIRSGNILSWFLAGNALVQSAKITSDVVMLRVCAVISLIMAVVGIPILQHINRNYRKWIREDDAKGRSQ